MSNNSVINVGIKKGTFYLSSKEDKGEGWDKQEFKNPQNPNEILVRYHKNVSIEGNLMYVGLQDDTYKGKVLSMLIKSDSETYGLKIPVKNKKSEIGSTNEYFNSVVGPLEQLSKGDKVTMFVNNKNKNKKDQLYRNIVILDSEGKLVKSSFSFKDVPGWAKTETTNEFGEKVTKYDPKESNIFYISKIQEVVKNFNTSSEDNQSTSNNNTNSTIVNQNPAPANSTFDEADHDLPF